MKGLLSLIIAAAIGTTQGAIAQTSPRVIQGYHCMMLNLSEQQTMDPNTRVPVLTQPADNAPHLGTAGSVVVIKDGPPSNGFYPMLMPNGKQGWIAASTVATYHAKADPSARCIPEVLSNGRVGFGPG
jgi:hypothetical protein